MFFERNYRDLASPSETFEENNYRKQINKSKHSHPDFLRLNDSEDFNLAFQYLLHYVLFFLSN